MVHSRLTIPLVLAEARTLLRASTAPDGIASKRTAGLAAAGLLGLTALGAFGLKRLRGNAGWGAHDHFVDASGGCQPDPGPYVPERIIVHNVDGANQGIAISMLRDKFAPSEESQTHDLSGIEGADETGVVSLGYDETIRSLVEVALNLAFELGEAQFTDECACGDPDCEPPGPDMETLTLLAAQQMTFFAVEWQNFATRHSLECRKCAADGHNTPGWLRAQFCRDLADDMLTNPESDDVGITGVPVAAAFEVVAGMVEVIDGAHGVAPADQIQRLSRGVAQSIAHKEGHPSHPLT